MSYRSHFLLKRCLTSSGKGLLNTGINNLPFEIHLPGYQYCGPGTKLNKRLSRGDLGINPLDVACKQHDIVYSHTDNIAARNQADLELANKAWERVKSKDAKLGERINAFLVTNIMKTKSKFGMGLKLQKNQLKHKKANVDNLNHLIVNSRAALKSKNPKTTQNAIKIALKAAKSHAQWKKIKLPRTRIIPVPKVGGILPLLPLFASLSAIGALSGGAAGIAKAINEAKAAKNQLEENQRHNKKMEAIAIGKGLFLKPYKNGLGLYLKQKKNL